MSFIRPMLAKRYEARRHDATVFPCYVQPKLNGIRAMYCDGVMWSRDLHQYHAPVVAHIVKPLFETIGPGIVLDGELYYHGWPLQKINGAIGVNRLEPNNFTERVEYHVFDVVSKAGFADRNNWLSIALPICPQIQRVQTRFVSSVREADHYFRAFTTNDFEGMMIRLPNAPYGLLSDCGNQENRWNYLLKRKDFLDAEFLITGITEGEGQFKQSLGALVCETSDGKTFHVGTGFEIETRRKFWNDPPIHRLATVKYEMFSVDGIPLKPVFLSLR